MIKTHPPPQDGPNPAPQLPELNTLLPMLLGDCDHAPDGCDTETYLAMLDTLDAPQGQKREFIRILQTLIDTVIGISFGVDPATLELKSRSPKLASDSPDMVRSNLTSNIGLDAGFAAASTNRPKGGADERIQE